MEGGAPARQRAAAVTGWTTLIAAAPSRSTTVTVFLSDETRASTTGAGPLATYQNRSKEKLVEE